MVRRVAAKDFAAAVKHYSAGIDLRPASHVLWSNRAAAHCGLLSYAAALADAVQCVQLAPSWGKGYVRKGAALVGLRRPADALSVFTAGLKVRQCVS